MKHVHLMYVPFTGLGLYGGHRGRRWLKNRITVFKQFVVPSLEAQTSQDFKIWISWRREDRGDRQINELEEYLVNRFGRERVVFTYGGVCFWDDKYEDKEARERLVVSLHETMTQLVNYLSSDERVVEDVYMTIQPSDDCYHNKLVEEVGWFFDKNPDYDAVGYPHGYLMNYKTLELNEYNPNTNPPFFTIKMPKETFMLAYAHMEFTGPYKSHEYVGDHMKYGYMDRRGFIVGTHGENISTHFNHPFAGEKVDKPEGFDWLSVVKPLRIKYSWRKALMRRFPHGWQRKLRYIFGEKLYAKFYRFIRS